MLLHTILIKPASGLCNMRCSYCFYCDEMDKREEGYKVAESRSIDDVAQKLVEAYKEVLEI